MVLGLGTAVEHPILRIRILEARDLAPLTQAPVHAGLGGTHAPVQSRDGYGAGGVDPLALAPGATPVNTSTGVNTTGYGAPLNAGGAADTRASANTGTHATGNTGTHATGNAAHIPGVSGSEITAERLAAQNQSTLASGVLAHGAIREIPDPLVKISLKGLLKKKFNTRTVLNTIHPVWNEEFIFEPKHSEKDQLVVSVYDGTASAKNLLGMVRIPVIEYLNRGVLDEWRPLATKAGTPARGDVHIQIAYGTNFPAPLIHDSQSVAGVPTGNQQGFVGGNQQGFVGGNQQGFVGGNQGLVGQQGLVGNQGVNQGAHFGTGVNQGNVPVAHGGFPSGTQSTTTTTTHTAI